jgi:transglutaminase-like putative cysteine protease
MVGLRPHQRLPVGERHVAIGRGRDYSDVPPVKGIYAGNAEHTMRVAVRGDIELRGPGLIREKGR